MRHWAARWASALDQVRRSLFFLPLLAVIIAGIAARALVSVEGRAAAMLDADHRRVRNAFERRFAT